MCPTMESTAGNHEDLGLEYTGAGTLGSGDVSCRSKSASIPRGENMQREGVDDTIGAQLPGQVGLGPSGTRRIN
ncbi:hypothetical protein JB92DRAFT_2849278 [Gautieria morchelliformis]|nr:hypothetical protein JB92DRAFT_2849278 [Gautieria morchelliformis]